MKKILFLSLMLLSTYAQAQDSLLFAGSRVIISNAGIQRTFPLKNLSYVPTFAGRYQIKVDKETIFDGVFANLYIAGATTIAQKRTVLDTKVDASVASSSSGGGGGSGGDVAIPSLTQKSNDDISPFLGNLKFAPIGGYNNNDDVWQVITLNGNGFLKTVDVMTNDYLGNQSSTAPSTDNGYANINGRLARVSERLSTLINTTGTPVQNSLAKTNNVDVDYSNVKFMPIGGINDGNGKWNAAMISGGALRTTDFDSQELIGYLTATAPASDNASSSLNGRLQRVAQRLTTLINSLTVYSYTNHKTTALSNSAVIVKNSPGNIYGIRIINPNASPIYVKFYNSATVTVGTTVPIETIQIKASDSKEFMPTAFPINNFTNSIKMVCTANLADTDTTAPGTPVFVEVKYN